MSAALKTGNTGCDCVTDCGDDQRVRDGKVPLCEWGAARKAESDARQRMQDHGAELLAAVRALVDRDLGYESGFVDRGLIRIQDVQAARRAIAKVVGSAT